MPTRRARLPWSALAPLLLAGCGGGPSVQELCAAIAIASPIVFFVVFAVLMFLEQVRGARDRGEGPSVRGFLTTLIGLIALAALAYALGARPHEDTLLLVVVLFGVIAAMVALIVWRARARAAYASRMLLGAQVGVLLGLPALVLWHPSLGGLAEPYIQGLMLAAFAAVYVTPLLLLGLFIECLVRRFAPGPGDDEPRPGRDA